MAWRDRLQESFEQRTGRVIVERDELDLLEAVQRDHGALRRDLDLLGWNVLEYMGGQPHEVNVQSRRKFARQARNVWVNDPLVGGTINLRNQYVFGRGVPTPRAKDPEVQKVIDELWLDEDNQAVLTGHAAQMALGVDLELQANLFFTAFADGDDGRVKLSLLDHDTVADVVRDPDNRMRVLYYVCDEVTRKWDYKADRPDFNPQSTKRVYYKAFGNRKPDPPEIKGKLGDGLVFHVAVNRTSEQVFGTPSLRRTIRWITAMNDYLAARVDVMSAAAAFVMKRKVKGSPSQVQKLAAQAISREGPLSTGQQVPPTSGAILTENESVSTEPFNVNTGAGNAMQDIQMLRSQYSVASGFPQHYLGDSSATSLGTAGALEGPVLKSIEAYQEVFEQVFRWFTDFGIERAVDVGRLTNVTIDDLPAALRTRLMEDAPDDGDDSGEESRDLSYEFQMPNPLRRQMGDLINAVATVAKTFDPNATNLELSRALLGIALGEGLEVQEPGRMVESIFPDGYVDPALAAMQGQQGGQEGGQESLQNRGGPNDDLEGDPFARNPDNPYSAPMNARTTDGEGRMVDEALGDGFDSDVREVVEQVLLDQLIGPDGDADHALTAEP